jgi:hypothetical protein
MNLRTKTILAVVGVVLIINGLYRAHVERQREAEAQSIREFRERINAATPGIAVFEKERREADERELERRLERNRQIRDAAETSARESAQAAELSDRLKGIEEAIREADVQRRIEAAGRP